jgi:hypothetical protein
MLDTVNHLGDSYENQDELNEAEEMYKKLPGHECVQQYKPALNISENVSSYYVK